MFVISFSFWIKSKIKRYRKIKFAIIEKAIIFESLFFSDTSKTPTRIGNGWRFSSAIKSKKRIFNKEYFLRLIKVANEINKIKISSFPLKIKWFIGGLIIKKVIKT